ncbi:MAG TPA: cytochrome P450 [Nocardioidaceae bacterium]|nr:cytochrome P450 [Nocardioidaceae bacterium]
MRTISGDHTVALLRKGYALLPDLRRQAGDPTVRTRLLGMRVVSVCGPEAARRFYDEDQFVRHGALPGAVQRTLTGVGAVHTLDGDAHRQRKSLFLALRDPVAVKAVVDRTAEEWDAAAKRWQQADRVVLLDEAAEVLMRAVCAWAGVPLGDAHARSASADMVALVDGFGTLGPRHWRARLARRRAEQRLEDTVLRVRAGRETVAPGSMFERVLQHRDQRGDLLDARMVAIETLNVLRPAVATTWFVAFSAHALHRWPALRLRLQEDDEPFAEAFAHEVRRFYPFAPFMGALARRDLSWDDDVVEAGTLVLLDLFGQNHDENLWEQPYVFRPERFLGRRPGAFDLVPQGGGDPATGHRCPGEDIVVETLKTLVPRLARLRYDVPEQDLAISLSRMPARPRSGVVISDVRTGG